MSSYPSKRFKIQSLYKIYYQISIDVVNNNKSPLTRALLYDKIGRENTYEISQYDFNGLITSMIKKLKERMEKSSYEQTKSYILLHPKLHKLHSVFTNLTKNILEGIAFRLSEETIKDIYDITDNKLGEVIELAIGLFIVLSDEETYNLILFTAKHYDL